MLNFISSITRGVHQQLVGSEHSNQAGSGLSRIGAAVLLSSVLTACGGGGGDNPVFGGGSGTGSGGTGGEVTTTGEVKIGNGTAADFVQNTLGASATSLAAGATATVFADIVDENNDALTDSVAVTFSSACVAAGDASFGSPTVTTSTGRASTSFTDLGCAGATSSLAETITATITVNGEDKSATVNLTIAADSSIGSGTGTSFVEGLLGASSDELDAGNSVILTANLVDYNNQPITDVANVTFTSDCVSNGDATLSATSGPTVNGEISVTYTDDGCSSATASVDDIVTARVIVDGTPITAVTTLNIAANAKIGRGTGASFVESEINVAASNIAAGGSTTLVVNIVGFDNVAIRDEVEVEFSSVCLGEGKASFSEGTVTTSAGRAKTTYTDNGCSTTSAPTTDTITARAVIDGVELTATGDVTIAENGVVSVRYVEATNTQLQIQGLGGVETTELTFRLVGANDAPITNESVTFSLANRAGNVGFSDPSGVQETKTVNTDADGQAKVTLQSGSVATNVQVIANHDNTSIRGVSETIVITTGVPIANRFSLSVETLNPVRAHEVDGVEVDLTVRASDQFGNFAIDGTRVSFWTPETGSIDPFCELVNGACTVTWYSARSADLGDKRLIVMAHVEGAEEFTDLNGNNVFDQSGEFSLGFDLGEAYVDENESLAYDLGEFFVDRNYNGVRDGGNGVWDGPCLSGYDNSLTTAICDGFESIVMYDSALIVMPTDDARLTSVLLDGAPISVGDTIDVSGGARTLTITLADDNTAADALGGNPMPNGTTVVFVADNGEILTGASHTVGNTTSPTVHSVVIKQDDTPGESDYLILTVTSPEGTETTFLWTVDD